jgi:hypothetical protein
MMMRVARRMQQNMSESSEEESRRGRARRGPAPTESESEVGKQRPGGKTEQEGRESEASSNEWELPNQTYYAKGKVQPLRLKPNRKWTSLEEEDDEDDDEHDQGKDGDTENEDDEVPSEREDEREEEDRLPDGDVMRRQDMAYIETKIWLPSMFTWDEATDLCKKYCGAGAYASHMVTEKGQMIKFEGNWFREWAFLLKMDLGMMREMENQCVQEYINNALQDEGRRTFFPVRAARKKRKLMMESLRRPKEELVQSAFGTDEVGEEKRGEGKRDEWDAPSEKGVTERTSKRQAA